MQTSPQMRLSISDDVISATHDSLVSALKHLAEVTRQDHTSKRSMRRFLASAWFPFCICLDLAVVSTIAYAVLQPTGDDIGNGQIQQIATYTAWSIGPIAGILSMIVAGILNLIRRIVRLRKTTLLHPMVVLASIAPWFAFGWQVTGEPRYTPIARVVIDFAARPLLWGSLIAIILTILLSIPLLFPAKK